MSNETIIFIGRYHTCHRVAYEMRQHWEPFTFRHVTSHEHVLGLLRSTKIYAIGDLDPYHMQIAKRLEHLGYTVNYGIPEKEKPESRRNA